MLTWQQTRYFFLIAIIIGSAACAAPLEDSTESGSFFESAQLRASCGLGELSLSAESFRLTQGSRPSLSVPAFSYTSTEGEVINLNSLQNMELTPLATDRANPACMYQQSFQFQNEHGQGLVIAFKLPGVFVEGQCTTQPLPSDTFIEVELQNLHGFRDAIAASHDSFVYQIAGDPSAELPSGMGCSEQSTTIPLHVHSTLTSDCSLDGSAVASTDLGILQDTGNNHNACRTFDLPPGTEICFAYRAVNQSMIDNPSMTASIINVTKQGVYRARLSFACDTLGVFSGFPECHYGDLQSSTDGAEPGSVVCGQDNISLSPFRTRIDVGDFVCGGAENGNGQLCITNDSPFVESYRLEFNVN
ncbi:MAG: hypothetical protein IPJ88_11570 [Myxococcales bacterium]|nr:MAG: hypothetical protein IPJ88_11570 [Myxococcales bacterium]